jgi:hypothetical protein
VIAAPALAEKGACGGVWNLKRNVPVPMLLILRVSVSDAPAAMKHHSTADDPNCICGVPSIVYETGTLRLPVDHSTSM